MSRTLTSALIALLLTTSPAFAQMGGGARATSLGGGYMGLARGYEALDWNTGNLALLDAPTWSVGLIQTTVSAAVVGLDFSDFTLLFEDDITTSEQAAFLGAVDPAGLDMAARGAVQGVGFSAGRFAASASVVGLANIDASRELLELYLDTRRLGDIDPAKLTRYRVGETGFRDGAFYHIQAGFAAALDEASDVEFPLSLGITGRLVRGIDLQRARFFEPIIDLDNLDLVLPIASIRSSGAKGWGVDLGLAAQPVPSLVLGVAVRNMWRGLEWDDELEFRYIELSGRELGETHPDELADRLEPRPLDPDNPPLEAAVILAETGGDFFRDAMLPKVWSAGASWTGSLLSAGLTYSQLADDGELSAGWPRYLGGGLELDLWALELRAGAATSFDASWLLSAGFGLHLGPVRLDLAGARLDGGESRATRPEDFRFPERFGAGDGWTASLGLGLMP